jgi:hypothetical protein
MLKQVAQRRKQPGVYLVDFSVFAIPKECVIYKLFPSAQRALQPVLGMDLFRAALGKILGSAQLVLAKVYFMSAVKCYFSMWFRCCHSGCRLRTSRSEVLDRMAKIGVRSCHDEMIGGWL